MPHWERYFEARDSMCDDCDRLIPDEVQELIERISGEKHKYFEGIWNIMKKIIYFEKKLRRWRKWSGGSH